MRWSLALVCAIVLLRVGKCTTCVDELDTQWCDARPYETTLGLHRPTADDNFEACVQRADFIAQTNCATDEECRMPLGIDVAHIGMQLECHEGNCTMPCTPDIHHPSRVINAYLVVHADCSKTTVPDADSCPAPGALDCTPGLLQQYKTGCCNHNAAARGMRTSRDLTYVLLRACCLSPSLCGSFVDYW